MVFDNQEGDTDVHLLLSGASDGSFLGTLLPDGLPFMAVHLHTSKVYLVIDVLLFCSLTCINVFLGISRSPHEPCCFQLDLEMKDTPKCDMKARSKIAVTVYKMKIAFHKV